MQRRTTSLAAGVLAPLLLVSLAACGSEPEPLEALPPAAPEDLCALLPESAVGGLVGTASSSQEGNPTAACALREGQAGTGSTSILVTYLQLEGEPAARTAWESQCAAIDRATLPERPARVEGAQESCAGAGEQRASLAVLSGRDLLTVRLDARGGTPLRRAVTLAAGALAELPKVE